MAAIAAVPAVMAWLHREDRIKGFDEEPFVKDPLGSEPPQNPPAPVGGVVIVWTQDWDSVRSDPREYIERWTGRLFDQCVAQHPDGKVSYTDGYGWYFKKLDGPFFNEQEARNAVEYWKSKGYTLRRVDR